MFFIILGRYSRTQVACSENKNSALRGVRFRVATANKVGFDSGNRFPGLFDVFMPYLPVNTTNIYLYLDYLIISTDFLYTWRKSFMNKEL